LTYFFRPHYGPGIDSASNRNEYQKYFLGSKGGQCVGLTTLPPSFADCHEIRELQPPGTLWSMSGLYRDFFTFTLDVVLGMRNYCYLLIPDISRKQEKIFAYLSLH
jgi:hypothetical protein